MVDWIRNDLGVTSLKYQTLDQRESAIGLSRENLCTYCWNGCGTRAEPRGLRAFGRDVNQFDCPDGVRRGNGEFLASERLRRKQLTRGAFSSILRGIAHVRASLEHPNG